MQKNTANTTLQGRINTLAQNGTAMLDKSVLIVNGNGSDLNKTKAIKVRAKRKLITQATVLSMIDVQKNNGKTDMTKGLWNTYHCQNKVFTANGRLYAKYCKNRFCTLCCAIRKADIINRYLPVIKTWGKPCLVTLTFKACNKINLRKWLQGILRGFRKIIAKYKKRNQRGTAIKLMGIKSLECNFNPITKTYNPHFHLIVPNEQIAIILKEEWLKICTIKFAVPYAQNIKIIFNNEIALLEVIKYGSKIFTEPDVNKKSNRANELSKNNRNLHAAALNNIFEAMRGLRIFERFGFNLPKESKRKAVGTSIVKDFEEWHFDAKRNNWINTNTDNPLTNYIPEASLLHLLENKIDLSLE